MCLVGVGEPGTSGDKSASSSSRPVPGTNRLIRGPRGDSLSGMVKVRVRFKMKACLEHGKSKASKASEWNEQGD